MIEILSNPWPWYVAGPMIALVMFALLYFGENFGMSSNLRTMCSVAGAGKINDFFNLKVKDQLWNLTFVLGSIMGGYIAYHYFTPDTVIDLSESTKQQLTSLGFENPGADYLPSEIFGTDKLGSFSGLLILLLGGGLVGFGSRYAGGCTSGHAISGLSNLQLPSLIAVIGFFIGGLIMVHLLIPIIF